MRANRFFSLRLCLDHVPSTWKRTVHKLNERLLKLENPVNHNWELTTNQLSQCKTGNNGVGEGVIPLDDIIRRPGPLRHYNRISGA